MIKYYYFHVKKLEVTTILVSIGDGKFWTPIIKKLSLVINCNVYVMILVSHIG